MALFDELHTQGQTIILVTHEPDIAAHATRQVHLMDGKIARDATEAKHSLMNAMRATALVALALAAACTKEEAPVPVYQALPVERRDIVVSARASGTIQPDTSRGQVAGQRRSAARSGCRPARS